MKLLSTLLVMALALGSAPAWAWNCAMARPASGDMLACAKLCAHSDALLTEGGKLAGLGARCMQGAVLKAPSALQTARVAAPAPSTSFAAFVPQSVAVPAALALPGLAGRAPPLPFASQFLLALPQGLAPPVLG